MLRVFQPSAAPRWPATRPSKMDKVQHIRIRNSSLWMREVPSSRPRQWRRFHELYPWQSRPNIWKFPRKVIVWEKKHFLSVCMHPASSQNIDKRFATSESSCDCDFIADPCVCKCTASGPSVAEPLKWIEWINIGYWICVSFSKISFSLCVWKLLCGVCQWKSLFPANRIEMVAFEAAAKSLNVQETAVSICRWESNVRESIGARSVVLCEFTGGNGLWKDPSLRTHRMTRGVITSISVYPNRDQLIHLCAHGASFPLVQTSHFSSNATHPKALVPSIIHFFLSSIWICHWFSSLVWCTSLFLRVQIVDNNLPRMCLLSITLLQKADLMLKVTRYKDQVTGKTRNKSFSPSCLVSRRRTIARAWWINGSSFMENVSFGTKQ